MIPKKYFDHIQNVYGEAGRSWIARVPALIKRAEIIWELSDLEIFEHLSYNLLLMGKSKKYGQVMVKIGVLNDEYKRELKFLSELKSEKYVTCHDVLIDEGMMIMKLLKPGTRIKDLETLEERLEIVPQLMSYTPTVALHPSYLKYHRSVFNNTMKKNKALIENANLKDRYKLAEEYYIDLMTQYSDQVILHGDLHHENMIFDAGDGWQIIDPKAYLGMKVMEAGRYIINQIWEDLRLDRNWTDETIRVLSEQLNYPVDVLLKSAYVDCMLSSVWSLEDGYFDNENLNTFKYLEKALM